jgi:L-ascorbate metabolism protein UlaG (beta-lactamase superfamily)
VRIAKFVHSCLLVETAERVALFDPGVYSEAALDITQIDRLHDIFITHEHPDHFSRELIRQLIEKFPHVHITSTSPVVKELKELGITATDRPTSGVVLFNSPHESMAPLVPEPPEETGIHYLNMLTHPGDSHSFKETKTILALPVTAPWGSSARAVRIGLELKPTHILPIHAWHWSTEARRLMYDRFENFFGGHDITFHKLETGRPIEIDV